LILRSDTATFRLSAFCIRRFTRKSPDTPLKNHGA
jgi:hypothetical protein